MGSFSIVHWGVVLLVIVLLFGTKKLANVGSDLGKAVKGFKEGVNGVGDSTPSSVSAHGTGEAVRPD